MHALSSSLTRAVMHACAQVLLGATERTVASSQDALRHLSTAMAARRVGSTVANSRSSRSHAIIRVSG
jgi:hypothetical protein